MVEKVTDSVDHSVVESACDLVHNAVWNIANILIRKSAEDSVEDSVRNLVAGSSADSVSLPVVLSIWDLIDLSVNTRTDNPIRTSVELEMERW